MHKLFRSEKFFLLLWMSGFLWAVFWFFACFEHFEPHWFQRSGALPIITGTLLASRGGLRLSGRRLFFEIEQEEDTTDTYLDHVALRFGAIQILFGTAIASYGDLFIGWVASE